MRAGLVVPAAAIGAALVLVAVACGSDGGEIGADAGADGSTSASADGGAIDPAPPGTPLDPSVAGRAAVMLASCISDDGINRTLQEMYLQRTTNPFLSREVIACLGARTNGCAALTDCVGLAYARDAAPCETACNGSVFTRCRDGIRRTDDCARVGLACSVDAGGCIPSGGERCDPSTYQGSCEGDRPVSCADRVVQRGFDCAAAGGRCALLATFGGEGPDGGTMYGCEGAGETCRGTSNDDVTTMNWEGVRCEGAKLIGCLSNHLAPLDCASVGAGFTCFEAPEGEETSRAYCGTAAECAPKSPWEKVAATCEGISVVYCNGGKIERVDCTSLGFSSCERGVCRPGFL